MKSVSKLVTQAIKGDILLSWKKKSLNGNESIKEDINNENNENEKVFENI